MNKDIYVVAVTIPNGKTYISNEGYETFEEAKTFIEGRADNPVKLEFLLTWVGTEYVYEIHLIKVGV